MPPSPSPPPPLPTDVMLAREIAAIIAAAVETDPALERFSLRDVKAALRDRLALDDAALKDAHVKTFVRETTTAVVEHTLQQKQSTQEEQIEPREGTPSQSPLRRDPHEEPPEEPPEEPSGSPDLTSTYDVSKGQQPKRAWQSRSRSASLSLEGVKDPSPPRFLHAESDVSSFDEAEDEEGSGSKKKPVKRKLPPYSGTEKSKKRGKPSSTAGSTSRARGPATSAGTGPEAEVARLKSFVLACGVRKRWQSYFRDNQAIPPEGEEADSATLRKQARVLKSLLQELGMTGRLSMEKAKKIKAERELQSELADIGAPSFSAKHSSPRSGTPADNEDEALDSRKPSHAARKRRAITTSDSEDEPDRNSDHGATRKQPRSNTQAPAAPETPEAVRRRRAFRQSLISESDQEQ